jgi:hypothetical protein
MHLIHHKVSYQDLTHDIVEAHNEEKVENQCLSSLIVTTTVSGNLERKNFVSKFYYNSYDSESKHDHGRLSQRIQQLLSFVHYL